MMTRFINFYPATLKSAAMDGKPDGNMRANLYLFKVSKETPKSSMAPLENLVPKKPVTYPPVILEDEGAAGMYNRANRSLHHFVENVPGFIMIYALAAFVFPFVAMVCAITFAVGRCLHQSGYTKGYGKHARGFALSILSTATLEGLVLVCVLKGFHLW